MMRRTGMVLAVFAVAAISCRGCHEQGPGDIFQLAPADTLGVVHVRDVKAAVRAYEQFLGHLTHKAGGGAVKRVREGLQKQLGFDPINASAWDEVGVRGGAGALFYLDGTGSNIYPMVALGVADKDKFERSLRGLITRVDGADRFGDRTLQGRQVTTAGRAFGGQTVEAFHWAYVGDWVLLTRGPWLSALDATLARLAPTPDSGTGVKAVSKSPSLADDQHFIATRRHLSPGLVFWQAKLPTPNSPVLDASWTFGADGFSGDVQLSLAGKQSATPKDNHDSLLPLAAHTSVESVLVFLSRAVNTQTWDTYVNAFDPNTTIDTAPYLGLRLKEDILPMLEGPVTVGINFADPNTVTSQLRAIGNPMQSLDVLQLAVTAQVKDANAMAALLQREQASMGSKGKGVRTRPATVPGAPKGKDKIVVYEPDTATPRLGWTIYGDQYVYGAGVGALDMALGRLVGDDTGLGEQLDHGVVGDLAGAKSGLLVLRCGKIADVLDAAQKGQAAPMGVGAIMGTVAEVLRTLDDVAVGFDIDEGGVRLRAREQLR